MHFKQFKAILDHVLTFLGGLKMSLVKIELQSIMANIMLVTTSTHRTETASIVAGPVYAFRVIRINIGSSASWSKP